MDRPRYFPLEIPPSKRAAARQQISPPKKRRGHHPGLDDGPNFSEVFATPSPCFAVNYNDLGNLYDASNRLNRLRFRALLRRHGVASHSLRNTSRCGRRRVTPCKLAEWGREGQ